jgi:hypothetical protein
MWIINKDSLKWTQNTDTLPTSDFDALKQDLKSLRFYQKVLSGSTFVNTNDLDDIYDVIGNYEQRTYNYNYSFSPYVSPYFNSIEDEITISSTQSQYEFQNKFLQEYGLTLKNLFTPKRLIDEQYTNLLYVDVSTTAIIDDLSVKFPNLVIDGVTVKEGHRILVKNQYSLITIPDTTDPSTYFDGFYEINEEIGSSITYLVYNSNNGIYTYQNQRLVRTTDLDNYEDVIKYSVCVKLGTVNRETQWVLNRLNNGFFPEYKKGQTMYFKERHNYVLRNRMDYNNLFELTLYDTYKHATQSLSKDGVNYTIPSRTITIGEFGVIIVHQEGFSNIINSKYKVNLRSIDATSEFYWMCGDDGTLLKMNKISLDVERVNLSQILIPPSPGIPKDPRVYQNNGQVITQLNCVSFFNDLKGVVVGKFNQIWTTDNGGLNWKRVNIVDFDSYNYNIALYHKIDSFYVAGDNGVFIEYTYESGNWKVFKRRVSKFVDEDDEFLLVDDIKDLSYFTASSNFSTGVGRYLALACTNNNLYVYDIDRKIKSDFSFIHLDSPTFGDISSITYKYPNLYLSTFEKIYQVSPFSGTFSNSFSNIISNTYVDYFTQSGINSIINSNDELIITGNNSLWKTDASGTFSDVYDSLFFDNLKPRFLFMDYDAGSKVYWFDDFGQYRIPERFVVPVSYLISPTSVTETSIEFGRNLKEISDLETGLTYSYLETNWITYWKDRLKTFEYYTHLSDGFKVEPSFKFSSSDQLSGDFTYSSVDLTTSYNDIQPLMPSNTSRYREGVTPISSPLVNKSLYFYKFLGIWAITIGATHSPPTKGDVLYIESDVFTGEFITNKIWSETDGTFTTYYQYFYTDFNENILNNLGSVNQIKIRNLNRYQTKKGGVSEVSYSATGYTRGSYVNMSSIGGTSTFDIEVDGSGSVASVLVNQPGSGYSIGDTITISGSQIGGTSDLTLTITSIDYNSLFFDNFKKHYISKAYDIETIFDDYPKPTSSPIGLTYSFQVTGKYSQYSAYYNLQSNIQVLSTSGFLLEEEIKYPSGFLNFGYTPTYNLLSYLNFINPKLYTPNKEFLALPKYDIIPGPDSGVADTSVTNDNILYTDLVYGTYSTKYESNKLYFGVNLKPLWESFMKWTFIDVTIVEGLSYPPTSSNNETKTERLIVIDKYYDEDTYGVPYYVLVLHDSFTADNNDICAITVHSRRTLQQISDDLQYINNLHRPQWSEKNIEVGYTYTNYETNINFKISTDSYTKALLSDSQFVKDITAVIYTDYKYELAIQITKLNREFEFINPVVIQSLNNKYQLSFPSKHNLQDGEGINIQLVGSQSNWPKLLGYHTTNLLDEYTVEVNIDWEGFIPLDQFKVTYTKKDPFLNFEPIDIFDLGVGDKKVKQSIEVTRENWDVVGSKYILQNIDFKKYRFRLIDGLDLVRLTDEYYWILDAEVSDAIIGLDKDQKLVWYQGIWEGGRWFEGTWVSGIWKSGDWYDGTWTSKIITDKLLSVKIDNSNNNEYSSTWYGGRWFSGSWENGTWYNGRWYGGTWNTGRWFDGTWNDGTWMNGVFKGGTWVLGTWNNGLFNTDNSLSYWLDGKFLGGDFENGTWYNGEFNELPNFKSRFGTKAFNSRNANWYGGKFLKGEFHSFLNINDNGLPDVSEIHKYSNWYSGLFSGGTFYGGNVFNINFNSSVWQGGILNDIDIIHIKSNNQFNSFVLDGVYRFNINDIFFVVDNLKTGTYSVFGSTRDPLKYVVLDTTIDEDANTTEIFVDRRLSDILSVNTGVINTGLKCVSSFKGSTWNSGIWFNGVFDEGYFNGGMWYHGNFSGVWG